MLEVEEGTIKDGVVTQLVNKQDKGANAVN